MAHPGTRLPAPPSHGNAAKTFHSIPITAFFLGAAAPKGHESTSVLLLLFLFTGGGAERGRDNTATGPGAWPACRTRLPGPYEVMENSLDQVLLLSASCSSYTLGKCYKHTGTI